VAQEHRRNERARDRESLFSGASCTKEGGDEGSTSREENKVQLEV